MSPAWQRCDRCKKIRAAEDFDDATLVCAECRSRVERPKAATVRVSRAPASAASSARPPAPAHEGALVGLGARGRGDREVRVRRARLRALEALAVAHPEEFEKLLAVERSAEGL